MAYEILVGLHVTDQESYQKYREAMTPILHEHGGDFGYDFHIAAVLKPLEEKQINRVFTIYFPSQENTMLSSPIPITKPHAQSSLNPLSLTSTSSLPTNVINSYNSDIIATT